MPDVTIDFDKIGQRILAMPLPARRYVGLQAGKAGTLCWPSRRRRRVRVSPERPCIATICASGAGDVLVSGVRFFEVSANGEKILTAQGDAGRFRTLRPLPPAQWSAGSRPTPRLPPPPAGGARASFTLRTDDIEVRSDPPLEWKQMYHDAWRIQREFFYDPESARPRSRGRDQDATSRTSRRSSRAAT